MPALMYFCLYMKIGATGTPNRIAELNARISSVCEVTEIKNNQFSGYDVIFDLNFDDEPSRISNYLGLNNTLIIVSAVKIQLEAVLNSIGNPILCQLAGMNCLPGFINRPLTEVCVTDEASRTALDQVAEYLGLNLKYVDSRVGMVTPRLICMIINEAYYTLQEGTASATDIDLGMKLGTNYPKGPFEWAREMGIKNVYETLLALWNDTHEERYKICPLLKTEYLKSNRA